MKRLLLILLFTLHYALGVGLLTPPQLHADPQDAVVRIPSHGISGTVVEVKDGKSYILSCAHGFGEEAPDPRLLAKPIVIDAPDPNPQSKKVGTRIVAIDWRWDLSLIEVNAELPYVCPIAPRSAEISHNIHSVGYDAMKWPATDRAATLIDRGPQAKQWTVEQPRPGRSGGGLLDLDNNCLIGVCHGYFTGDIEGHHSPGIYVSIYAIHIFMDELPPPPTSFPGVQIKERDGRAGGVSPLIPGPSCPGGS
jgi:hypothetical protein